MIVRTHLLINPKLINGQFITVHCVSYGLNNFFFSKSFYLHVFHRIKESVILEGTTVGHLAQPPCSNRVMSEHMAQGCVCLTNSSEGDSLTSLDSLFQCVVTYTVKKIFLTFIYSFTVLVLLNYRSDIFPVMSVTYVFAQKLHSSYFFIYLPYNWEGELERIISFGSINLKQLFPAFCFFVGAFWWSGFFI